VEPNVPGGGVGNSGTLPVIPPAEGPGPIDTGLEIDTTPPNYDGLYPRQDLTKFMKWCQSLPKLGAIQGIIMTMLTNHFADPKNIENPTLREYVWTPETTSPIIISVEEDWEAEYINRKPAIFLKRQAVVIDKIAIGDMKQSGRIDGVTEYDVLVKGSHVLKCHQRLGQPTDDLAWEAFSVILRAAPFIRKWLGLSELRANYIGSKEQQEKSGDIAYFVPVTVPWAFQYPFKTRAAAPTIRYIDLAFFG
jgi:hypothetical protein